MVKFQIKRIAAASEQTQCHLRYNSYPHLPTLCPCTLPRQLYSPFMALIK